MTVYEVLAYGAGYALAATKLLNAAKPWWNKLPAKLATALPAVVVLLPALAERLGALKTDADLKTLGLAVLGLLLPGAAGALHAKDEAPKS